MSSNRLFVAFALAALAIGVAAPAVAAEPSHPVTDWPQFRGVDVDGISVAEIFGPLDSVGLSAVWRQPIGSGYSGISISGDRLVTMFSDGAVDLAAAFDATTGRELWRFVMDETYKGHDGSHDGPLATPLLADGRVFGLSPRGRLFALSIDGGEVVWSTDLVADHGARKPHYGFATSPILMDGVLIVQVGAEEGAVAGFDPATGERKWLSGEDRIEYQSPVAFELDGRRHLLAAGHAKLIGMDPTSGEVLWEYEHQGGGARGVASLVPVPAGDGRIFLAYKDEASAMVRVARGEDGSIAGEQLWEDRSIRNSYNVPVYHDGHVYAFSSRFLTCVDAETGKSVWKSRAPGDGFLILVDGHLVVLTKQGGVHVVQASPKGYNEVAAVELFEGLAWSPPSFAAGSIFVRSLDAVARVDVGEAAVETEMAAADGDEEAAGTTSGFAAFRARVEAASEADRSGMVDRFMEETESFPLVEPDGMVHFVYRGPGEDLAIGGDMIGARQEKPMTRLAGTDLFFYSTRLEADARVNYVFLKDYSEALVDSGNPRRTYTTLFNSEMEIGFSPKGLDMSWLAMPEWQPPAHLGDPTPGAEGRIESHELESAALEQTHEVDVYLPAGYDADERRFPVLYVHGGEGAKERGELPRALDNTIGSTVEPVIVVFVKVQTAPFRGFDTYAQMIAEELIPFVDSSYRTMPEPGARAAYGAGFSGYAALYCAIKNPGEVGKVATQSLFMLESMQAALEPLIQSATDQPLDLYLEWGRYDLRNPHENWDMGLINERFVTLLREKGYEPAGGEVNDGTGWPSWRNRTDRVLGALFPANGES